MRSERDKLRIKCKTGNKMIKGLIRKIGLPIFGGLLLWFICENILSRANVYFGSNKNVDSDVVGKPLCLVLNPDVPCQLENRISLEIKEAIGTPVLIKNSSFFKGEICNAVIKEFNRKNQLYKLEGRLNGFEKKALVNITKDIDETIKAIAIEESRRLKVIRQEISKARLNEEGEMGKAGVNEEGLIAKARSEGDQFWVISEVKGNTTRSHIVPFSRYPELKQLSIERSRAILARRDMVNEEINRIIGRNGLAVFD